MIIRSSSSLKSSLLAGRMATMRPSRWPEWVIGMTRSDASSRPRSRPLNHTLTQADPDAPARATTCCSSGVSSRRAGGASGTETDLSRRPSDPVHISAEARPRVLRSDSATWRSSSSMGTARDKRLPKVLRTWSGASRSP